MFDIIIADDDRFYARALSKTIGYSNALNQFFTVKELMRDPASPSIEEGDLFKFIRVNCDYYSNSEPLFLILDVHFGSQRQSLGLEIAQAIAKSEFAEIVRIIIITGGNDQRLFDQLFACGVINMVRKENVETSMVPALLHAKANHSFTDDLMVNIPNAPFDLSTITNQIALEIAKGYSNKSLLDKSTGGFSGVGPLKRKFRLKHLDNFYDHIAPKNKMPKEVEWNDVWFLLYFLSVKSPEIIEYVEDICGVKITYPTQ
jgi:hypothetical protein